MTRDKAKRRTRDEEDVTLTRAEATWVYWQIAPQYDESGPPPLSVFFAAMNKLRPSDAEVAAVYAAKAAALAQQTQGQG